MGKVNTGLSKAIQQTLCDIEDKNKMMQKKPEFFIKVANTLTERESVFKLAYQIYLEKGYINVNENEWLVQSYDAFPETVILLVQDQNRKIAGSLTLVFGEDSKLPVEKIYKEEVKSLKMKGEKLVEISRLVISHEYRNSKEVLLLLTNYLMIYCYYIKKYSSLIIEVNPRHKNYYKSLLNFDEIGVEKLCPSVKNAPAVLLHLPLIRYQAEVYYFHKSPIENHKTRSLYAYFLRPEQEKLVAHYLEKQVKEISIEEKTYFGFTESGINGAVCV